MKNMYEQYNKLNDMMEKIVDIHDNDWNEDRDITDKEKKRCNKIDEQISDLEYCVAYIENAMYCLEDYIY